MPKAALADGVLFQAGVGSTLELKDAWDDGVSSGAKHAFDEQGRLVVTGTQEAQSYGSVHTGIEIDLEKHGILEVEVAEVSKHGYVQVIGSQFENGYATFAPNFHKPGTYRYDLRLQTGQRTGRLAARFQIGVGSGGEAANKGEKLVIKDIRLLSLKSAEARDSIPLFDAGDHRSMLCRFADSWENGNGAGAVAKVDQDKLVIEGVSEDQMFGAVIVNAVVDLDRFGGLLLDVDSVTMRGYVVVHHPALPAGWSKVDPEITGPGEYRFDLRRIIGRGGTTGVKVLLGVTSYGASPKAVGQSMRIRRAAFVEPPVREITGLTPVGEPEEIAPPPAASGASLPTMDDLPTDALIENTAMRVGSGSVSGSAGKIVVRSGNTELALSDAGKILSVKDLASGQGVSTGGPLFAIETADSGIIFSDEAVKSGLAQCEVKLRDKEALLQFAFSNMQIDVTASAATGGVALSATVRSTTAKVLGMTLPGRVDFPLGKLQEVTVPRWLGVGLGPKFFAEERSHTINYPAGFSDLVHARWDRANLALLGGGLPDLPDRPGNLMRYRGPGIKGDEWVGQRPTMTTVSGEAGHGAIARSIPMRLAPGQSFHSGEVLVAAGMELPGAVWLYRARIYPKDVKSLADRLGADRFKKYASAALIKMDCQGYASSKQLWRDVELLPDGILLHPVTYWPKGFDRNYPDFFPAEDRIGGNAGLKYITEAAHGRGMLVVPYVNPSWWTPSPTTTRVGIEKVSIRKEDGSIPVDIYGENSGWIVSPWAEEVTKTRIGLHTPVMKDLGMDGIFEDQIGARDWLHDFSANAPAPLSYTEGMVRWAASNPLDGILMTEGGFDALAPYEHGLCGLSNIWSWPHSTIQDAWFGKGNWRYVPVSSMVAHDLADFMHHNLAVEVRTDSLKKLAWNMVYGYHLFEIMAQNNTPEHVAWTNAIQPFQRDVVSRVTGRRLTGWREKDGIVTTRYDGGTAVLANFGGDAVEAASLRIPRDGAVAVGENIAGGIVDRVGDFTLGGPVRLIVQRDGGSVNVRVAESERMLVAIPRDPAWTNDPAIEVTDVAGSAPRRIPAAVTDQAVVFLHAPPNRGEARYRVGAKPMTWNARIVPDGDPIAGDTVVVHLEISAGPETLAVEAVELRAWAAHLRGPVPSAEGGKSRAVGVTVPAGRATRIATAIALPPDLRSSERLWISAKVKTSRGTETVSCILGITEGLSVTADLPEAVRAGRKEILPVSIENHMGREVTGKLLMLVDGKSSGETALTVTIAPRKSWTGKVALAGLLPGGHDLTIGFEPKGGEASASLRHRFDAVPAIAVTDFAGRNLIPSKGMIVPLRLVTPPGRPFEGSAEITATGGWKAKASSSKVKIAGGGEVRVPIAITPGPDADATITVRITSPDGEVAKYAESFSRVDSGVKLIRADLNGDGKEDLALGHAGLEAQVNVALGGRILFLAGEDGMNRLYAPYPAVTRGPDPKAWVEYGGVNDWWPAGWPGDVWNNEWSVQAAQASGSRVRVAMATKSGNGALSLKRVLWIEAGSPVLAADYEIENISEKPVKQVWMSHPDIAVGPTGAGPEDRIVVPTESGVMIHPYKRRTAKFSFTPGAGWAAGQDGKTEDFLAILFKKGSLKEVGTWEGESFFTMEAIRPEKELAPREKESFLVGYGVGSGDPADAAGRWSDALASGQAPK